MDGHKELKRRKKWRRKHTERETHTVDEKERCNKLEMQQKKE